MALLQRRDGESFPLEPEGVTVGRDPANHLVLGSDLKVSRHHAELQVRPQGWVLIDLGSRNGSYVNGERVDERKLSSGDRVRFGTTEFFFIDPSDPQATIGDEGGAQSPLSVRERQVVAMVGSGRTDRQISEALGIALSTVRSHLDRIAERTGRRRRSDLTRLAVELGLLDHPEN